MLGLLKFVAGLCALFNQLLFGLDGEYFKVLIDNVPIINEGGFGNGTDLTLINLDDVERIEIVEGAMGVQYGSNAFTGIINIITKKSSRYNMVGEKVNRCVRKRWGGPRM